MAVTVTNATIAVLDARQAFTKNAATSTVTNGTEVFTLTPTVSGGKLAIFFQNASTSAAYTYSIAAGDLWASAAITGTTAAVAGIDVIQVETAKVMKNNGTIAITLTPSTGAALVAGHTAAVYALELK
jgi:hypothetical protein